MIEKEGHIWKVKKAVNQYLYINNELFLQYVKYVTFW